MDRKSRFTYPGSPSDNTERDWLEGPTDAELDAIEAEWPEIAADLAVLDVQIELMAAGLWIGPRHHRRMRRATRRLLALRTEMTGSDLDEVAWS